MSSPILTEDLMVVNSSSKSNGMRAETLNLIHVDTVDCHEFVSK